MPNVSRTSKYQFFDSHIGRSLCTINELAIWLGHEKKTEPWVSSAFQTGPMGDITVSLVCVHSSLSICESVVYMLFTVLLSCQMETDVFDELSKILGACLLFIATCVSFLSSRVLFFSTADRISMRRSYCK